MKIVLTYGQNLPDSLRLELWSDDEVLVDVRERKISPFDGMLATWVSMLQGVEDEDLPV